MEKIQILLSQILFLFMFSFNPGFAQQPYEVEDIDMALIYYKLSGAELPWKEIALNYPEYLINPNAFARQDFLEKLEPIILEQTNSLFQKKSLVVFTNLELQEYDSDQTAFFLDFSDNSYLLYDSYPSAHEDIALTFDNGAQFTTWFVNKEEARKITQQIGRNRAVVAIIEFVPVAAKRGKLSDSDMESKIIQANIIRITFQTLDTRIQLGSIEAKAK